MSCEKVPKDRTVIQKEGWHAQGGYRLLGLTEKGKKGSKVTQNIPILPIGILDFCKQKLAAPPLGL